MFYDGIGGGEGGEFEKWNTLIKKVQDCAR